MRVSVSRAEVVTGRTPFELLARSENELEELTHDWVFGSYGSKQRIIFLSVGIYMINSQRVGGPRSWSSGAEAREISDMTQGFGHNSLCV